MFPNKFRNTFGFPCTSVIFVAEKIFSVLSNYGESGCETMYPALSTVGKPMARKQCFLVCQPLENMTGKQCSLVCPYNFGKHGYRKQCFLVCQHLENMARKQCFLVCPLLRNMVCPPLGNMTRKQLPAKPFSSLPQVLVYSCPKLDLHAVLVDLNIFFHQ
jgi:hypothetical protein